MTENVTKLFPHLGIQNLLNIDIKYSDTSKNLTIDFYFIPLYCIIAHLWYSKYLFSCERSLDLWWKWFEQAISGICSKSGYRILNTVSTNKHVKLCSNFILTAVHLLHRFCNLNKIRYYEAISLVTLLIQSNKASHYRGYAQLSLGLYCIDVSREVRQLERMTALFWGKFLPRV